MVLVSSFVVKPSRRIALNGSFLFVGGFNAVVVVLNAPKKFGGGVFRKVVKKPLPKDSRLFAMSDNPMSVTSNCG